MLGMWGNILRTSAIILITSPATFAGFDIWINPNVQSATYELYARNRGIGGMFGAGTQTGTSLTALDLRYAGGAVSQFPTTWDFSNDVPIAVVDLNSTLTARSGFQLGSNSRFVPTSPGPEIENWQSLSQFTVAGTATNPPLATGLQGYRFGRLYSTPWTFATFAGKVTGDTGPAASYSLSRAIAFIDAAYFDQLSYDATLPLSSPEGTFVTGGALTGFISATGTDYSAENLPSFLTLHETFIDYFTVQTNRALTPADVGIYVATLHGQNGGMDVTANLTIQILPEPMLAGSLSLLVPFARRRRR
jgi:hypothetical protein